MQWLRRGPAPNWRAAIRRAPIVGVLAAAAASFRQKRPRSLQDYMRTNDKGGWLIVKPTGYRRPATNNCTKLALNDLYVGILFMFICVHSITEYGPRPVFRGGRAKRVRLGQE